MTTLAQKKCIPCQGGILPLKGEPLKKIYNQLGNQWKVINEHHIEKGYLFKTYREGLEFTKKLGELAEKEGHHPVILLGFKEVKVTLWTHKIDGLSESDFIYAAKADEFFF